MSGRVRTDGVNLTIAETLICNILQKRKFAEVLQIKKIMVWDEITMVHKDSAEALNRSL